MFGAAALAAGVLVGALTLGATPTGEPHLGAGKAVSSAVVVEASALLDPAYFSGAAPLSFARTVPLGSTFQPIASAPPAAVAQLENAPPVPIAVPSTPITESGQVPFMPAGPRLGESVPLPTRRPPEFRLAARQGPFGASGRASGHRMLQRNRTIALPAAPPDNRNFLEKLFGMAPQPPGPALGYAAPEDGFFGRMRSMGPGPVLPYDRLTAVYDIAAHTVYLPNGARLEAHSGLGQRLDDPGSVHERDRGATPPTVYELALREQPFHGVQALRLNPVGSRGTFGRTGFLAHTYMLGPNGDSNGCVVFKDYNAFLQAFRNGEVRRLAVVARLN